METADCHSGQFSSLGDEGSSTAEQQSANWALLPGDVLQSVLDRLVPEVTDYVRFAAVCKEWLTAARDHQALHWRRPIFPVLLLPAEDKSDTRRGWYNAIENRTINSRLRVPSAKRCCGSSRGWLIFPDETLALTLFNPSSGATIHLPPVTRVPTEEEIRRRFKYDPEYEIVKVVLSADPLIAPDSYEAIASYVDGKIALYKSGRRRWIHITSHLYLNEVTYFKGNFYGTNPGCLARIDARKNNSDSYKQTTLYRRRRRARKGDKAYLARTPCGRLLRVERYYVHRRIGISRDERDNTASYCEMGDQFYDREEVLCGCSEIDANIREKGAMNYHRTSRFIVNEVKEVQGKTVLARLKTLGDQILFLGHNDSECVWARDFPEYKANCIYYMDDCLVFPIGAYYYPLGAIDIGVFDLDTQCCKQFDVAGPGKGCMPPPIWMFPPKPQLGGRSFS